MYLNFQHFNRGAQMVTVARLTLSSYERNALLGYLRPHIRASRRFGEPVVTVQGLLAGIEFGSYESFRIHQFEYRVRGFVGFLGKLLSGQVCNF